MKKKPDQVYRGKYQDSMDVVGARKEKKKFKVYKASDWNFEIIDDNKVGADGGFDREVDPDCESGICGAR